MSWCVIRSHFHLHMYASLYSQLDVFHACPQGGCDREQFQSSVANLKRLDEAYARCIADLEARGSSRNAPPISDLAWEAPSLVEEFPSSAVVGGREGGREGGSASYQKGDVLKSGRLSEGTLAKKAEGWKKARDERLQRHAGKPIMRCTGPNMAGTCSATGPEGQEHKIGPRDKRQHCGYYKLPID